MKLEWCYEINCKQGKNTALCLDVDRLADNTEYFFYSFSPKEQLFLKNIM